MRKSFLVTALVVLGLNAGTVKAGADDITAVSFRSTNGNYWKMQEEQVMSESVGKAQVIIRTDQPQQTFKGWGTTFNELDYDALKLLSDADQQLFIKRAFNPNGDLRLNVGRIPVGASDYACDWYSCDETVADGTTTVNYKGTEYTVPNYATDFTMEHFTIARDKTKIIPFIKLAQAENNDIDFWASPWSPPSWMKVNKHYAQLQTGTNGCPFGVAPYNNDQFIDDPDYYNAYCLYFDKFIQAYGEEGIGITGLAYQNEAYSNTAYPGCSWTAATTGKFLAQYLGPYMAEHQPDVDIILGTMNTNQYNVYSTILNTSNIGNYVKQIGFQWEGGQQIGNVRAAYPGYELVQTESECGNGTFDWNAAAHTFQLCNHYLANGCTTYSYWNAILKDNGVSHWGWVQNSLVQVNSGTNTARYCPEYFAYKHYTHLIPEGSQILTCDETNLITSALTPDGNVVVVVGNNGTADKTLTVDINGKALICNVAAKSFASYVVGTEANVTKMLKSEAQGLVAIEGASLTSAQTSALTAAIDANTYSTLVAAVADVESHREILNPSFTTNADGWIVANVAASGDFKQAMVLGKTCYNNWSKNFTSMDVHQDLTGLPSGIYTVSAKSLCGEGNIQDQHVYAETSTHIVTSPVKADDVWSAEHWETQTTEQIYVAEGDYLRVGYASTSGGGTKGWFCVTDFVLTRVGDLTEDFDLTINLKDTGLEAAKTAYNEKADEASPMTVDSRYGVSERLALTTMLAQHKTLLPTLSSPALVQNLQRELEEQMEAVISSIAYVPQEVGAGDFFLYDLTTGKFFNYNASEANLPILADTPARIQLTSNGEDTYAIRLFDVNYLKIGVWNNRYIFNDASDENNTKWIFTPVYGKENTYIISTDEYAETGTSGTYYINGYNATTNAAEAHEFILVNTGEYVNLTDNATAMVAWPVITANTDMANNNGYYKRWLRDSSCQAGDYAENQSAINSDAHSGYGISYWRGSAVQNVNLIYQTISGLPAGTYRLEAYAAATVWSGGNVGDHNMSGCYVFANDSQTEVTTARYGLYTVEFCLDGNEDLTLGLKAGNDNGNNWCYLSDITLTYGIDRTATAYMGVNPDVKYGTFCAPFEVKVPSAVTAYRCTGVSGSALTLDEVDPVPANTPVILYAEEGYPNTEYRGNRIGSDDIVNAGLLYGNVTDAALDITDTGHEYILQRQDDVTAFYKIDGSGYKVGANRCYLQLPSGNSARLAFYFDEDDDPTSVTSIPNRGFNKTLGDGTYLINGRVVVVKSGVKYSLNGQIIK